MRVLVTGGAGFIGSHFARRLAALGEEVVVLDKLTYSGNRANLDDVEHDDLVAERREAPCEVRADEACAAGDEHSHRSKAMHSRRPSRQCGSSGAPFSERRTE